MKPVWTDLLSLFFPDVCVICETPLIDGEEKVCLGCLNKLPYASMQKGKNPAGKFFAGRGNLSSAHAFLYYSKGGITQRLVFALKYYGNKKLAATLGRIAARRLPESPDFTLPDILIPVPLHKKRLKKRGYNQSEWIARGLSAIWRAPVDTNHLLRIEKTKTQTRKSLYERLISMETAFRLDNKEDLEGKHVLLIDDVMTSGATLEACIHELSRCNNIKISIFCLSITE